MKTCLNKIFVYGTLRPDIKAPWNDIVHNNDKFKLSFHKAHVSNAVLELFRDYDFPNVCFDEKKFTENQIVNGFILETSNINETLKVLDEIEDYPSFYERIIIRSYNIEKCEYEFAYMYTINKENDIMKSVYNCEVNDMKLYLEKKSHDKFILKKEFFDQNIKK